MHPIRPLWVNGYEEVRCDHHVTTGPTPSHGAAILYTGATGGVWRRMSRIRDEAEWGEARCEVCDRANPGPKS